MIPGSPPENALDPNIGRVLRIGGGEYEVGTPLGVVPSTLRGRVKRHDDRIVSVGDLVRIERLDGGARIVDLLPRRSALTRHGVARRREQVIVANVDQVAVVLAARSPEPDLLMVDRLLALAELNEIEAFIVVNKLDLVDSRRCDGDDGATELALTVPGIADYAAAGYDLLPTSAPRNLGIDRLARRLQGRVTVFTGQSGVGKSSLLNALVPGLELRVGEVGEKKGRGRHTTVAASLYPFPGDAWVADTPGLQVLALWEVDPRDLGRAFREFAEPAMSCRFADCLHRAEPECAVRAAVERGAIPRRRYESYLRLLEEAEGK